MYKHQRDFTRIDEAIDLCILTAAKGTVGKPVVRMRDQVFKVAWEGLHCLAYLHTAVWNGTRI